MPLKTSRLLVAIIPAVFAFFLASVFAMAISEEFVVATLVGVGAALSSMAVILKH